ncbi:MAG: NUDIX domain-containing protein [Gemmatimonadales bacterium]|nr:NUDIX domain-containing protein [Gemmatimonadales bacterium]
MTTVRVSLIDLYVMRGAGASLECLALRRAPGGRCPGSWEAVHGHIEAGERPEEAAIREMGEETGLVPARVYNLSRVESFYQHRIDEVALVPIFVAFVADGALPTIGPEHDDCEWLTAADARQRMAWPRERRAVADIVAMLGAGDAGLLEDVLRVC